MKLPLEVLAGIEMLVIVVVSPVSRKDPPADDVVSVTVVAVDFVAGAPVELCSWTVMVLEVSPAVSVCAPVVKASFVGVTGAVTVRLEVADLPLKLPVTVWEPVAVAVHVAPVQEPFGEIVNVVEDVTLPRLLLKTSNAVVV